jgi:RNA polymerase sigma factor (sigma-70 family)
VINEARRRAGARPVPDLLAADAPAASRDDDPRTAAVRAALEALTARQREVVFLRYFADLDEASIASALGIRRGTVAATLHRVHARIRAAVEHRGVES